MKYSLFIIISCLAFLSCKKDDIEENQNSSEYNNGILVLNEGLFQQNNASLSWIDLSTNEVTNQIFLSTNDRPLGDTGNDMGVYGGKLYIVVNASSTVEVLDKRSLKSIKQVQLQYDGQGQQPRSIAFHLGKAYITSYDGYVNILDTTSLIITNRIQVGQNPEGLGVYGNDLFVSNSGGLSFPDVDSTVFKIDLFTHQVTDTFVVGNNPGDLVCDDQGDVYVVKRGDYSENDPSELIRIDQNGDVEQTGIHASTLTKNDHQLYISYYNYNSGQGNVSVFDLENEILLNNGLINSSEVETLYGFTFHMNKGYACDAMNFTNSGYIKSFDEFGDIDQSYHVGLNPTKIIYYD